MRWFKLFTEARNDPKLRLLSDGEHRVWFSLLCMAAEQPTPGLIVGYSTFLLAVEVCNGEEDRLASTLARMSFLGIVEVDGDRVRVCYFANPRYESDLARARREWNNLRPKLAPLVVAKFGALCRKCGCTSEITIDHIIPLSKGGGSGLENLAPLCRSCNSTKGAKYHGMD